MYCHVSSCHSDTVIGIFQVSLIEFLGHGPQYLREYSPIDFSEIFNLAEIRIKIRTNLVESSLSYLIRINILIYFSNSFIHISYFYFTLLNIHRWCKRRTVGSDSVKSLPRYPHIYIENAQI
jgi:hypothetical protein